MTLAALDLATVRRRTGDANAPYDLSDVEIGAVYDDSTRGNSDLNRTTFFVLRERLGIASNAIAISNPMGGMQRNQKFDQIWRLLQYWAGITGLDPDNVNEGGFAGWSDYDV